MDNFGFQSMTLNEANILQGLLGVIGDGECSGPVAERDIQGAELELGAKLPPSYRIFLKHFGAAWLPGSMEIFGLGPGRSTGPEPPRWSHVVDVTTQRRRVLRGHIPTAFIPICDDGGDYQFYLDTDKVDSCGECPVIVLGPGRDGNIVATNFVNFVELAVAGILKY